MLETTFRPEDPVLEDPRKHLQAIIDSSSTSKLEHYLQQVPEAGLSILDTVPSRPEVQPLVEIIAQQVDGVYNPQVEKNLILPIDRLPFEILESIFQEYLSLMRPDAMKPYRVHKHGTGVDNRAVLSLALVSRRWHRIVFATPSLWAVVSLTTPLALVDKGLNLSGSHPLDVHCETYIDCENDEGVRAIKTSFPKFIQAVTPHLGRCRLIRVAFAGVWIQEIGQMISSFNDTIETLEMCRYPLTPQPESDLITLFRTPFQHQAPKLARIKISRVQFYWDSFESFPALQTLQIYDITLVASRIERLKECLALRVLELHNAPLDDYVLGQGPFFDLPNLRRLVCTHTMSNGAGPMKPLALSRFRSLRSLESIYLSVDFWGLRDNEAYFQANFAHLSSDFSRILSSSTSIHIDSEEHTTLNNRTASLRLSFPNNMPHFLWRFFGDIVSENGFSGGIYLSVRNHSLRYISEDSWGWLHLNVSRVTLQGEQRASVPLEEVSEGLRSLGHFLEDPHHWSTLECIRLDFDEVQLDWLAACLKKRYSGTHDSSVEPRHVNIEIKCWEDGTSGLEELEATHGVDTLVMDERGRDTLSRP